MTKNPKPKAAQKKTTVSLVTWLALALTVAGVGWSGLYYLATTIHPNPWAQAVFLALWGLALVGTCWPVLLAINQRWSQYATPLRVWRQSIWIGALGTLVAWLQMNRVLTLALAVTVAGLLGVIELLLILREREEKQRNDDE